MKFRNIFKRLTIFALVSSLLCGQFAFFAYATLTPSNELQHNTVMNSNGEWVTNSDVFNSQLVDYNCYAYAIGSFEFPPFYTPAYNEDSGGYCMQYQPGDMCGENFLITETTSIEYIASLVKNDLIAIGHDSESIDYSLTIPDTSSLEPSQELICVRIGMDLSGNYDYHFMRYDRITDAWYHKPASSAILKYNYSPWDQSHSEWSGEGQFQYSGVCTTDYTYSSDIMYITYSKLQLDISSGKANQSITINARKNICYEIIVPETGNYTIQLTSQVDNANYIYDIYSYNMYNGNYTSLKYDVGNYNSTVTEIVNFVSPEDIENPYQVNKYYIKMDFFGTNEIEQSIVVSITHPHSYNSYDILSNTQHKAYCECGEYELQDHIFDGYTNITDSHHTKACVCEQTGETEEHYHHRYERDGSSTHKVYCECGHYIGAYFHVVPVGDALYKWCIHCGQKIYSKIEFTPVPGGMNSTTPSIRYITEAGSYVDSDGIIYLVESDMALYLAGELDVYALAQNVGGLVTQ